MSDDIISGWNIVSTNSSDIVMDDVTRDDIIDIITEIKKISRVDKLVDILKTFDGHIKLYNKVNLLDYRYDLATSVNQLLITTIKDGDPVPSVNPHNTRLKYLTGNILNKLYTTWLLRGNSESMDAFRDLLYKYQKYGTLLDVFNHTSDEVLISVKEFVDYFNMYHNNLLDIFDNDVFVISQKNTQWSGEIHGLELTADPDDHTKKILSKTDRYAENIWYTCHVDISPRFESAKAHLEIDSEEEMKVEYKLENQSSWIELTDYVLVDIYKQFLPSGEIINILDSSSYRYRLPTELENLFTGKITSQADLNVTVNFRVSPKRNSDQLFDIRDIFIIVDGDGKISDDIYKREFYANPPHSTILAKFFNHGIDKIPSATCVANKRILPESFNFKVISGSICCKYQPYTAIKKTLPVGSTNVEQMYKNTVYKLVDTNNKTLIEVVANITGTLVSPDIYSNIKDINFVLIDKDGVEHSLFNGTASLRNIYNFVISYISFNYIKVFYQDNTGEVIAHTLDISSFVNDDVVVNAVIPNTSITTGVQEFIYYSSILSDGCVAMNILGDSKHWPYL